MSNLFLAIVTVLYAGIAADQVIKAEYAMALVWTGYALANMVWTGYALANMVWTGYALANIGFLLVVK